MINHKYDTNIKEIIGKTMLKVERTDEIDGDTITFYAEDGTIYDMYHYNDCCESVTIEDICGDLNDLVGYPILMAEEVYSDSEPPTVDPDFPNYEPESYTWTFYKFATVKGYVTIRWYGTSNGYYSETATFMERIF